MESRQPSITKPKRPLGITILSILFSLSGIYSFGSGLAAVTALFFYSVGHIYQYDIIGLTNFPSGIIFFMVAYGIFEPKSWGWKVAIIFTLVYTAKTIVASIISVDLAAPVSVIFSLFTLYYLFRPNVKRYFGKNTSPTTPNVPPTTTPDSPNNI